MSKKLIIKGTAASPGVSEGVIKIISGPSESFQFNEGDVLVAVTTEPTMVIMMNKACAIITDKGGITSHAAIVSRELGIPCVTATQTATKDLKNGMKVRVNGSIGEVYLLSS